MPARRDFGSIRQRGARYYGRYRVDQIDYYTPTRRTKTQVREDLARIQAQIADGEWVPPRIDRRSAPGAALAVRPTVEEYGVHWLAALKRAEASPNTLRTYRSNLNAHIVPAIGSLLLDEVTTADIAGVIARIDRSRVTKRNALRTISALLAYAHKAGVIGKVPALPSVERRSEPSKRRALTAPELRATCRCRSVNHRD